VLIYLREVMDMTHETVRSFATAAGNPAAGGLEGLFLRLHADTVARGFGLHFTSVERVVRSHFPQCSGTPEWVLEGWRKDRYVNSAFFRSSGPLVYTAVACRLPVFACQLRGGIPRVMRSPVSLPLGILEKAPSMDIASDGTNLFSLRMIRSTSRRKILRTQMESILLTESIIEGMETENQVGSCRLV
jgi:hypothetical protein